VLAAEPTATVVAGSTDVGLWVTKQMRAISPVVFINHLDGLHQIEAGEGGITIGAGVTYSRGLRDLAEAHSALGH
jgi:xanthine dehydrogenase small subunit